MIIIKERQKLLCCFFLSHVIRVPKFQETLENMKESMYKK